MAPVHRDISVVPLAPRPDLKLFRPESPYVALGLAVNHLMTKPAFANLKFGDWSRILVGQINRKHYCFVLDERNQVQGFVGWALTTQEHAEAWVEGRGAFSFEDSQAGDCIIFNAWAANSLKVNRFLLGEARKVIAGKDTVYFKRFYKDGSVRPARLRSTTSSHNASGDQTATRALHRTNRCAGDRPNVGCWHIATFARSYRCLESKSASGDLRTYKGGPVRTGSVAIGSGRQR